VEVEKGLITGQNPQSSSLVTQTVLDVLEKKFVWIDANLSIGAHSPSEALCNVDDAFGVLHLFNSVSVKVEGISTVFGNSDVDTALTQTRNWSPVLTRSFFRRAEAAKPAILLPDPDRIPLSAI